MHKRVKRKKIRKITYGGVIICGIIAIFVILTRDTYDFVSSDVLDRVTIVDDGHAVELHDLASGDVASVLAVYDEAIGENDRVFPARTAQVFSDDVITVEREKKVTVEVDGGEVELVTYRDNLAHVLARGGVSLDENDIIAPAKESIVSKDMKVDITRVVYKEEVKTKKIPFEKVVKEDDDINFLKRYVDQVGANGKKEITYKVAYHDGEEVARDVLSEEVVKEPVDEITVQGTQVKLGKKHTGLCSWYAYTGTMAAANPWLPKGSYVKVTNKANGKSVIVKINDRGPFVPGRIIDLDKVAFEKIAPLGAGVIDVKMEEVVE